MQKKFKRIKNARNERTRNTTIEKKNLFSTLYPSLCKPFTVGLFSTMLAASLCYTPNAMATTAEDLGLSGNTQALEQGQVIDTATKIEDTIDYSYSHQHDHSQENFHLYTVLDYHNEDEDGTSTITNDGTISLSGITLNSLTDNFAAIYTVDNKITVMNSGIINADIVSYKGASSGNAYAYSSGIYAEGNYLTVANSGSITLKAHSTSASVSDPSDVFCINTYGINMNAYGSSDNEGTVSNTGTINIIGISDNNYVNAYGIYIKGNIDITNSGTITVTAEAASASTAVAIEAFDLSEKTTNYGTLQATSTSTNSNAWAKGISFYSPTTISNQGTITAEAVAKNNGNAWAIGIEQVRNDACVATISNTGVINVSATSTGGNAYALQAYVNAGGSDTGIQVGTWAFTLGDYDNTLGDDKTVNTIFGVGNAGKLNLQDSTFIIRADSDTEYNKAYNVSNLVYIDGSGQVTGSVGSVSTELPFLVATLGTTEESGTSSSYTDQTITLTTNINANTSPGQGLASQSASTMQSSMHNLASILANQLNDIYSSAAVMVGNKKQENGTLTADSGQGISDASKSYYAANDTPWRAFIMPYYTHTSNHDFDYTTSMAGVAAGATYTFNDSWLAGFHLNLGSADTDSDHTNSKAKAVTLGAHALYHATPELYVRGHLSGYYSQNDHTFTGSGSAPLQANVDTNNMGIFASLAAGYDLTIAKHHTITPEIGLSYIYSKTDAYGIDYKSGQTTEYHLSYDKSDYDILYGEASLRWTAEYELGHGDNGVHYGTLSPTVRLGLRQALTDAKIESHMHFNGLSATTHSDANESAAIVEASLAWTFDNVTTSLSYSGDFGDAEDTHMGMFKLSYAF
ncbi:MAG: autotransporter domain-containing protein [Pseudomonadota bacterium]